MYLLLCFLLNNLFLNNLRDARQNKHLTDMTIHFILIRVFVKEQTVTLKTCLRLHAYYIGIHMTYCSKLFSKYEKLSYGLERKLKDR